METAYNDDQDPDIKIQDAIDFGKFENLGTAVKRVVGIGGAPFDGPDGTPYISSSVNGVPAQFVTLHALSLQVENVIAIPGTTSAPSMITGADGHVYIGTTGTAELYRYRPGTDALELLGQPIPGETYIYGLTTGPDGKIYGGTYPGGKMFEYDPVASAFRNFGTMVPGEKYVRQLEYDPERRLFYVGTGTGNKLVEFDPATGNVSENWMPTSLSIEEYANSMDLIDGKLYIQLNKSSMMLVIDVLSKEIEYKRTGVSAQVISSPDSSEVYMFIPGDSYVHAYDPHTKLTRPLFHFGPHNGWKSMRMIPSGSADTPTYIFSSWAGIHEAVTYEFATARHLGRTVDIPGQPIVINSIANGPDNKIYVSGMQGGVGTYHPASGLMETHVFGMSQSENMASIGNILYFGLYPQARLAMFDTSQPIGTGNPAEISRLPADSLQDRPFGMVAVEEHNKLFMGTVPQYGQLGGVFAIYDPMTGTMETHRHLVQDQSIITLMYQDGKVYGGTSIWGAYGAPDPTASEGKMFVWEVVAGMKVREFTPVEGKQAVTSLITGPDGRIWGFAEGVLFIYDPSSQTVIEQHEVMLIKYGGTVWRDAFMVVGPDSNVYGTARGVFFRIDGQSKQVTILNDDRRYDNVIQGPYGDLYMRTTIDGKKHELWRYSNPDLALSGLQVHIEDMSTAGTLDTELYRQLRNNVKQSVMHMSDARVDQAVHFLSQAVQVTKGGHDSNRTALSELENRMEWIISLLQN